MEEIIIQLINEYGYFAILFLIALENIFPPIPSEIILCFGGFATVKTELHMGNVILFATVGSVLGAIALYYVGKFLDKDKLERVVTGKIGKVLRIKISDIEKTEKWFRRRGRDAVLIGRCIPIIRSLISIPAGMTRMPIKQFMIYTILGTAIWNTILVSLGRIAGSNWQLISNIIDTYAKIIAIAFIIIIIIIIKKKNEKSNLK